MAENDTDKKGSASLHAALDNFHQPSDREQLNKATDRTQAGAMKIMRRLADEMGKFLKESGGKQVYFTHLWIDSNGQLDMKGQVTMDKENINSEHSQEAH